jgi:hypothetical protein
MLLHIKLSHGYNNIWCADIIHAAEGRSALEILQIVIPIAQVAF